MATDKSSTVLQPPRWSRFTRRISSSSVTREELDAGRASVVVPPGNMDQKGDAHEVATAMEHARREMEGLSTGVAEAPEDQYGTQEDLSIDFLPTTTTDKYAFAFDIDGVLIRGGEPIPEAVQAMKMLNGQNSRGIKVPYIFVTNGGGKTEAERCIQLSKQLEIEVSPGQFICGHTPMREMASMYETVLVVGGEGEKCREVAEGYGFKDVITPGDVIKTRHDTTPFRKLTEEEWNSSRVRDFSKIKVGAIFVFADSRDWAGDQQIILDFLTSKDGVLGTRSDTYDEGPPLFFAHNDVVWATSHESTRIGMGALRKSVEAMFEAVTGKTIETTAFGKPQMGTFGFATRLLQQWRNDTHGINAPPERIYFVGDTPESDIRGTNDFNDESENTWYSILVRTGVYREGTKPKYAPKATVDTVLDAVRHGMERELKMELTEQKKKAAARAANDSAVLSPTINEESGEGTPDTGGAEGYFPKTNGTNGTNGMNRTNGVH